MKENQADAIMTGRDGTTTHVWVGNTYMPAIILGALVCVGMLSARSVLGGYAAATKLALPSIAMWPRYARNDRQL